MDCVFCSIIASPDAQIIASDDRAVAFLDINPMQRGHTLVVPRRHVEDMTSDPDVINDIAPLAGRLAAQLKEKLGAEGVNLISSAGSVAGQEVFHMHAHLVPRYAALPGLKGLLQSLNAKPPATADELAEVYAQITAE